MKTAVLLAVLFLPSTAFGQLSPEQLNAFFDGQKKSKRGRIQLSDLAVRVPAPSAVNPMLTDPAFRPKTAAPAAEKSIGEARRRQEDNGVRWDLEVFGGGSIGIPGDISVNTHGARPAYVAARVGRWKNKAAWELEGINHYQRSGAGVGDNDILRGTSYFLVNRAYEVWGLMWRLGAGIVVTHPGPTAEEEARRSSGSYYLTALGTQASVAKRLYISDHAFTSLEGKLTGAIPQSRHPQNPIHPPPLSANGVLGLGFDF